MNDQGTTPRWAAVEEDLKEMRNVLEDLRSMADGYREFPLPTINNDECYQETMRLVIFIRDKVERMENYVHRHKPIELMGTI